MGLIFWFKIYRIFSPILKQIGKMGSMKLNVNVILQVLALIAQGLNQVSGIVPMKWQFYVAVAISIVQGIIAVMAHFANTDGTKQVLGLTPEQTEQANLQYQSKQFLLKDDGR